MLTWTGTVRHQRPVGRRWRRRVATALAGLAAAVLCLFALQADQQRARAQQPAGGHQAPAFGAPRTSAREMLARRPEPITLTSGTGDTAKKDGPAAPAAGPADPAAPPPAPPPLGANLP